MKLVCSKKELSSRISIVKTAVPTKTTMSILQFIYIEAENGVIRFFANDTENGIESIVNGDILEEGSLAIEADIFFSAVSSLAESDVTLTSDSDYKLIVECEKTKFTLPGRSGEDFTFPPTVEQIDGLVLSQKTLKKFISQTNFCVSVNDANKIMTGSLFEINDKTFSICALDGHRVAIRKKILEETHPSKKAIIPGKTLKKIEGILEDDEKKEMTLYITDHYAAFIIDDTTFVARLMEGEFFDIYQMLSGDYETKVTVNRKDFLSGISQAMSIAMESEKKPIILGITDDEDMTLKVSGTRGMMNGAVPVKKQGKDIMIGFNPRFLIEALKAIEDEDVDIYFVNPKTPCYIRNTENGYLYMILPINFKTVE